MDIDTVSQLISSIGFPIAAYMLMVFKIDKALEKLEETVTNNNNLMMRILDRLKIDGGDTQ